jgi:hypothetical protein
LSEIVRPRSASDEVVGGVGDKAAGYTADLKEAKALLDQLAT